MVKIVILDESTSNQIAAGEVIERPASIVKEMAENSLDAGATSITVEITGGGIKSIRVTDNGDGIEADDVAMAFERHATSKIRRIDDLDNLSTMGFRGEALASIASVSKVEVITKTEEAKVGTKVIVEAGDIISTEPVGAPKGTTFIVRELFYNTPARYKFLKKDSTEAGYIHDILVRIALARPDVSIKLVNQGKTVIHTPGNHDLLSVIYSIYGKDIARSVIPVNFSGDGIDITGFIGRPEISKGNRSSQSIFVNNRFIYNKIITAALEEACKTRLMQKRFPFAVLKINISPQFVDVNVHPAKLEVRFSDERKVFRAVHHAVMSALSGASLIPADKDVFKKNAVKEEDNADAKQMRFRSIPRMESEAMPTEENASGNKSEGLSISADTGNVSNYKTAVHVESGFSKSATEAMQGLYFVKREIYDTASDNEIMKSIAGAAPKPGEEKNTGPVATHDNNDPVANDRNKLLNAHVIGQIFNSFIILETGDELLLIDQHAAHERIQYEKTKKQYSEGNIYSQVLLNPLTVNLSMLEMDMFHELSRLLERLGFEVEDFGGKTIIIRAIPYVLGSGISEQDFIDILYKLQKETGSVSEIIPEETIYMMACKSAIKANREMPEMEIRGLIEDLTKTENPYTCVHGRPIIISVSRKELEKKFKRIL
jgi:DNA mismatch repair protein MutL